MKTGSTLTQLPLTLVNIAIIQIALLQVREWWLTIDCLRYVGKTGFKTSEQVLLNLFSSKRRNYCVSVCRLGVCNIVLGVAIFFSKIFCVTKLKRFHHLYGGIRTWKIRQIASVHVFAIWLHVVCYMCPGLQKSTM